jgi:hypothetical protein
VGSGEEFEGACKRRHGGGPDLNFYLLLAPIPQLSAAELTSLAYLHGSTQPDEREERERERERGKGA